MPLSDSLSLWLRLNYWLNLTKEGNSPARSTKSTPSHYYAPSEEEAQHSALTACKQMVSGSISFPSRGAFHLSLTVLVHYRSAGYLALESGLPSFPPGSSCPVVLKPQHHTVLSLWITGLSPTMAGLSRARSSKLRICNCARCPQHLNIGLTTPPVQRLRAITHGLVWAVPGSFATTTGIVSFLRGT
jgi:hypothetical protein